MYRRPLLLATLVSTLVLAGCIPHNAATPTTRVVQVPRSIDATGATDVSSAFAGFIASVPNGSVIELVPGGQYRMEQTLVLLNRYGLTFDGNGARIFATTPGDRVRSNIRLLGGSDIVFENLRVQGANPHAGKAPDAAFQLSKEAQHGFDILGSQRVALTGVTVNDTYGDFVHISKYGPWAKDIRITGSRFERNGRQGISVVAARDVLIEGNYLNDMRRATIDIEPDRGVDFGVDNVTVRNNDIGPGRLQFIAAGGTGPANNVTIQGNRLHGQALQIYMIDQYGGMRSNWRVLDNTSDIAFNAPHQAAMRFYRVNGLEIRGNTQAFTRGFLMYGAKVERSCNLELNGNTYANARAQSLVVGGC